MTKTLMQCIDRRSVSLRAIVWRAVAQFCPLIAVIVLGIAAASWCLPAQAPSNSQTRPRSGTQKPLVPEPGNVLPANRDARYTSAMEKRKQLLDSITPVTDQVLRRVETTQP